MNKIKSLLETLKASSRRAWHLATSFLPTSIPVGMTEFDRWSSSIYHSYGKGLTESDTKFLLAAQIMHMGPTESIKSKRYFGLVLRKGAANQIAHAVLADLKRKQAEAVEEAKRRDAQENQLSAITG